MTQQEILEKYPKIFQEKDLPMEQTCMCWGLDVPTSWLPIIDQLCASFSCGWTNQHMETLPQVVAKQVKEKFGELRFYYELVPEKPRGEMTEEEQGALDDHRKYIDGKIDFASDLCRNLRSFTEELAKDQL